jgi:hypothetical protein
VLAYRGDGEATMHTQLAVVAARIRRPLFDGFAVHHLASWRAMPA